jgi:hypothetical protein
MLVGKMFLHFYYLCNFSTLLSVTVLLAQYIKLSTALFHDYYILSVHFVLPSQKSYFPICYDMRGKW